MKAAVLLIALALTGCASEPVVVDRVVNQSIPVKCKAVKPVRPVMPTEVLAAEANEYEVVRAALAEIDVREGYEGLLVAALDQCLREPTGAARAAGQAPRASSAAE